MQNLKASYVRRVVSLFASGRYSEATEKRVGMWLTNGEDSKAKNEALESIWNESLAEIDTDNESADEVFDRWLKNNRIGVDCLKKPGETDGASYEKTLTASSYRSILRVWQGVAAILAVAVISMAWLLAGHNSSETSAPTIIQAYSPAGQIRNVILQDGTQVILNGASTITYLDRFAKDRRDVMLMGEADFKVAKDADRPFTVSTGDMDVTALGTEFNIKAYPGSRTVAATLVDGLVRVVYGTEEENRVPVGNAELHPAQQLLFDRSARVAEIKDVNLNDITAWQRGELVFDNVTLYEILNELENRFAHKFVYSLGALPADRYTFRFRKGMTLDEVMNVVEDVTGAVRCAIDDNTCNIYPNS